MTIDGINGSNREGGHKDKEGVESRRVIAGASSISITGFGTDVVGIMDLEIDLSEE